MPLRLRMASGPLMAGSVDPSTRPIRRAEENLPPDLQRTIEAVGRMRNRTVAAVVIRDDCRQLRITFDDGDALLMSVCVGENGEARLDADLLRSVALR